MKENEAIETLISIRRVSGYSKKREEALDMAISALERQEGKKPAHEASIYKCFTCPTCKNVIDHFEEFVPGQKTRILYKYCHFCGQRIDWSDEHGAD